MDFEYLVLKNAQLRAHISQRSNLRYVKTVLEHFDDRQRTDFRNSCLGFLSEIWAFEAMPEIGDRFAWRLGHQSPRLLSWTCTKQPQQRTYDEFFKNIKLHPKPLASGDNVGNSRGECTLVSSGGGSEDDEESGNSDDEGAGEETRGDKSGDGNGEASNEGDSGDNEDEHTRTP
ncbi:Hypothetical predicted protein [Olea europaea subsp. europaea]|uniref:Uncharacterized protein n=1 Tax=Olea europaea subsp. europaea TaxID=158383 RepID=A0A8S0QGJ4_OLEEU|nr:Hypothetical predicted protein [Olea europaea subsp. europaea]